MAIGGWLKGFISAIDATAARTAIGAGTSSVVLPATATAAELRAGTQTATRMVTPQVLANLAAASGTTAARPTDAIVGFPYFDTTLGKPVYLKVAPSTWVDAAGVAA